MEGGIAEPAGRHLVQGARGRHPVAEVAEQRGEEPAVVGGRQPPVRHADRQRRGVHAPQLLRLRALRARRGHHRGQRRQRVGGVEVVARRALPPQTVRQPVAQQPPEAEGAVDRLVNQSVVAHGHADRGQRRLVPALDVVHLVEPLTADVVGRRPQQAALDQLPVPRRQTLAEQVVGAGQRHDDVGLVQRLKRGPAAPAAARAVRPQRIGGVPPRVAGEHRGGAVGGARIPVQPPQQRRLQRAVREQVAGAEAPCLVERRPAPHAPVDRAGVRMRLARVEAQLHRVVGAEVVVIEPGRLVGRLQVHREQGAGTPAQTVARVGESAGAPARLRPLQHRVRDQPHGATQEPAVTSETTSGRMLTAAMRTGWYGVEALLPRDCGEFGTQTFVDQEPHDSCVSSSSGISLEVCGCVFLQGGSWLGITRRGCASAYAQAA